MSACGPQASIDPTFGKRRAQSMAGQIYGLVETNCLTKGMVSSK
jgi:hypothetical protein